MSDEQERPGVRRLWQSQMDEITSMSLDNLRNSVSNMNRNIRLRTFVAGLAFLIFIGFFFAVLLTWRVSPLVSKADVGITQGVIFIGAGFCLWWLISLLRRTRGQSLTPGEPSACAAFYRSELERQRNSCRRSAVLVPLGLSALCAWVVLVAEPFRALATIRDLMLVIWVLFVPFCVYQNMELARRSQRELDKLDAVSGE
jgi:hypothetical protein